MEAYETAAKELESLLKEQERIEERILSLRKTMNALATLISQHGEKNKDFIDHAGARLREIIDTSLTDDIHKIVAAATQPLTASEIRSELKELGNSLAEQSNPLATIYAILNRLSESGRVKETVKDGKKAWERYMRFSDRVLARIAKGKLSDMAGPPTRVIAKKTGMPSPPPPLIDPRTHENVQMSDLLRGKKAGK